MDIEQRPGAVDRAPEAAARLLAQARPAILFLAAMSAVRALSLFAMFVYNWNWRMPTGELFRERELAWLYLLAHIVNGAVYIAVAVLLLRYGRVVAESARRGAGDILPLLVAHRRLWVGVAVCVGLYFVFTIVAYIYSLYTASGPGKFVGGVIVAGVWLDALGR